MRQKIKTVAQRAQQGGVLMRGTRSHENRKRPCPRLERKRWNAQRDRGD